MGWIDVNDEIPDSGQQVIMYHPGRGVWVDKMWSVMANGGHTLHHLCTHWMPLPEPPKKDANAAIIP